MIRENRLFLGNPGAGKSTLINCLVGASKLKSGLSWGGGLTQDYQRVDHDGVAYMDTPGLADTAIAEQAAKAITTALKQGGQYKLFFMMRLQNGRVVSEDLVTLERVLGAIDMAASKIRFSVIFNNVDKKQYNPLTQPDSEAFKSVHSVVNGRQFKTDALCFIPAIAELDEASDAVVTLPQHVRDFMDEAAPSMRIKPSVVRAVDPTGFAQQARLIQEEMEKLLNSRATMMAAMAAQQQQNDAAMQREREAHAAQLQSMQRTPGEALSPRYDGDYYAAHPQTPPIGPAVGEPENKSLMNRKKLLVGAGVVAGAAVLITIIIVAVTSGGDTTQPSQPPSQPDLSRTATDTVAPVAKWKLLGCDDRDVRDSSVSINWQANIALAAELASQNSKPYFAVSADNTIAVAFSDLKPGSPKQSGQICDASVPGRSSWTIYKVITESKEPSQPQPSIPTSTETPTTTPTTTPVHTPAQTPTVTPMVTPTVTPAQMPTN